jgi:hypothetical protein
MSSDGRPPKSPSSGSSAARSMNTSDCNDAKKSTKRNSSDSPSNSATNHNGKHVLHDKIRSILSHSLGLPLLFAMIEKKVPEDLRQHIPAFQFHEDKNAYDNVLNECLDRWKNKEEKELTKDIPVEINNVATLKQHKNFCAHNQVHVQDEMKSAGYIDFLVSPESDKATPEEKSTPLMVVEVGLKSNDWFLKLDQGTKYLKRMCIDQCLKLAQFQHPILFSVMTIERLKHDQEGGKIDIQIGVFLACRKNESDFRLSLLRQIKTTDRTKASSFFGRMLWLSRELQEWRNNQKETSDYQYFSSNCCRIGQRVCCICWMCCFKW